MVGQQLVRTPQWDEPLALAADQFRELLRPPQPAIERAGDHRQVGPRGQRADRGGRERCDAVDQVELACLQFAAEPFPHKVLEDDVAGPGHGRVDRPAELVAPANEPGEPVHGPGDELVVDVDDFGQLRQVGRIDPVAVADVGDERDANVGPTGQRAGQVVADERDAGPGGVAGLGDQEDANRVGHAGPDWRGRAAVGYTATWPSRQAAGHLIPPPPPHTAIPPIPTLASVPPLTSLASIPPSRTLPPCPSISPSVGSVSWAKDQTVDSTRGFSGRSAAPACGP